VPPPAGPGAAAATIQLTAKGIKTRDALKKIFSPYGLSPYIIEDEVFLAPEDVGVRRQLTQRISLDLNEVPLADALKRLGRERAINLLVSREGAKLAEKKISLQVDDVPLETAIRLLADQAGMRAARMDNVLIITTPEHAKQINADNAARKAADSVPGAGPGYPAAQQWIERALSDPLVPNPIPKN
jgi:type II secretory pathway component HofQ